MTEWNGIPDNSDKIGWHWIVNRSEDVIPMKWDYIHWRNEWLWNDQSEDGFYLPEEIANLWKYAGPIADPPKDRLESALKSIREERAAKQRAEAARLANMKPYYPERFWEKKNG